MVTSHKEVQVKNIRYKNCSQWSCQETVPRIAFQELCRMWEMVFMPSPASTRTWECVRESHGGFLPSGVVLPCQDSLAFAGRKVRLNESIV